MYYTYLWDKVISEASFANSIRRIYWQARRRCGTAGRSSSLVALCLRMTWSGISLGVPRTWPLFKNKGIAQRGTVPRNSWQHFCLPYEIIHPWPHERFAVNHPRWKPGARIAPAGFCAGGRQQ